jgi:hypothetical protein
VCVCGCSFGGNISDLFIYSKTIRLILIYKIYQFNKS